MANELHARPFPVIKGPGRAVLLAIKTSKNAAYRNLNNERDFLLRLLDHFGSPHPELDVKHHFCKLANVWLKWEIHTEFTTFILIEDSTNDTDFSNTLFDLFPTEWLATAPGALLTTSQVIIEKYNSQTALETMITTAKTRKFSAESIAISQILGGAATILSDFKMDMSGHIRFAIFVPKETGARRIGRILQRLFEIELYKTMAMLTLPNARKVFVKVSKLDDELSGLTSQLSDKKISDGTAFEQLQKVSAQIELLASQNSFRFGATEAYSQIVKDRITIIREKRFQGYQTFSEFMMRRFEPTVRTCASAKIRLHELSDRAARLVVLLNTRIELVNSERNQKILEQMDKRAETQFRLQETVEGLSVVAISYYAINIGGYLLEPFAKWMGVSKTMLMAFISIPVLYAVWHLIQKIKKGSKH